MVSAKTVIDLSQYEWLFFDFDETLGVLDVDWNEVTSAIASLVPRDSKINFSVSSGVYENSIVEKYGVAFLPKIKKVLKEREHKKLNNFKPFFDLINFISSYTQAKLALYTSNSKSTVKYVLEQYKIWKQFDFVITRDDVLYIKPNPEGFELFFSTHAVQPERVLFIGDSNADRGAAKAAGVRFVHRDTFAKVLQL